MANLEDNTKRLNDLYIEAVSQRLCTSKKQFAELVGCTREAITNALNGNPTYATDKMVYRVTSALMGAGISIEDKIPDAGEDPNQGQGVAGEDLRHIVDRLVDEMARQRESYERLLMHAIGSMPKVADLDQKRTHIGHVADCASVCS